MIFETIVIPNVPDRMFTGIAVIVGIGILLFIGYLIWQMFDR